MTICNPATPTKPIPTCIGELTVGTVAFNLLSMFFIITDITTGRTFPITFSTDNAGLVVVDLSEIEFSDRHSYKASVHQTDNISNPETITISGQDVTEVELNFVRCVEDGEAFALPEVTLEAA